MRGQGGSREPPCSPFRLSVSIQYYLRGSRKFSVLSGRVSGMHRALPRKFRTVRHLTRLGTGPKIDRSCLQPGAHRDFGVRRSELSTPERLIVGSAVVAVAKVPSLKRSWPDAPPPTRGRRRWPT